MYLNDICGLNMCASIIFLKLSKVFCPLEEL